MNSRLLQAVGLEGTDPAYFILTLLVINIGLIVYITIVNRRLSKLYRKYDKFMRGKDTMSLEEVIFKRFDDIDRLVRHDNEKDRLLKELFAYVNMAVQKIGIVKYDAFNEMGGKLSFALAMLNRENSGYVINAMHSREGCYTYIKEIIRGESYIPLGGEEKQALAKAMENN